MSNLLRFSKSTISNINFVKEWEATLRTTHATVDNVISIITVERMSLARQFLETARHQKRRRPPALRESISKSYYALYHSLRAVVFVEEGGDDYNAHSELPKRIPTGFPSRDIWKSKITEARIARNQADYDCLGISESDLRSMAEDTLRDAELFIPLAETYLRRLGVAGV